MSVWQFSRAWAFGVALLTVPAARADNPLVEHAAQASREGRHAQAVADLRRAQASVLVKSDAPALVAALDRAHGAWLVQIAADLPAGDPVTHLAAHKRLIEEATKLGSASGIALLTARRDAIAETLRPRTTSGDLTTRLAAAREIQATGFVEGTWARVTELEREVATTAERLAGTDPYATYLRGQLKSYHRTIEPPAHPRPVAPRWSLETVASACDDVVSETRDALGNGGNDPITVRLEIAGCDAQEQRGSRREDMTWHRKEKRSRTVRTPREVTEWQRTPTSQRVCKPTYASESATYRSGDRVMTVPVKTGESCTTENSHKDEMVTREVIDEKLVEEEVDVPQTETVDVATRTTRLTISVGVRAVLAGRPHQFETSLSATTEDTAYTSSHVGSRSFGDPRAALRRDLGRQLAAKLDEFALASLRSARMAALEDELATAPGGDRMRVLRALAVEAGKAHPDLIQAVAQETALSAPIVGSAFAGERMAVPGAALTAELSFELPPPDEGAVRELYVAEERALISADAKNGGGGNLGFGKLASSSADGWIFNLDVRIYRVPRMMLFRTVRAGGLLDLGGLVGWGREGKAVLGGNASVGAFAGVAAGPFSLDAHGVVGVDGIRQGTEEGTVSPPGDPGIPAAPYIGYGAALQARVGTRALTVELRRHHRNDDVVPELWRAEVRLSKRNVFVGGRALAYQPLLDSDAQRGAWMVSFMLGAMVGGQDLRVGDAVSAKAHTRSP